MPITTWPDKSAYHVNFYQQWRRPLPLIRPYGVSIPGSRIDVNMYQWEFGANKKSHTKMDDNAKLKEWIIDHLMSEGGKANLPR